MSTPWTPDVACDMVRTHIEAGSFNGLYVMGTEETSGIVPCFESPRETGAMLALQVMAGKLPKPQWLIFLADTYHIELDDESDHPGSLEDAFKAGDPRVKEAAVVLCICPDGPTYQAIQTYVRDGIEIEWDEVDVQKNMTGLGGMMADLMLMVLETPHGVMPGAADGIEQIRMPLS